MTDHMLDHDVESEAHRADCAECQQLWTELEAIAVEARGLPTLTPSRDLWSGIEARIAGGSSIGATSVAPAVSPFKRVTRSQGFRLAMAASLLVALTSAVTWRLATSDATRPAATLVADGSAVDAPELPDAGGAVSADAAEMYLASFSASVSQMDREIATLQTIVSERRGELDPRTIEILETNLKLIDAAIAEARAALDADPASQFLAKQFTRAYTSKLTLLRGAAQLPAGI